MCSGREERRSVEPLPYQRCNVVGAVRAGPRGQRPDQRWKIQPEQVMSSQHQLLVGRVVVLEVGPISRLRPKQFPEPDPRGLPA